ncbi:D-xylulose kinase [Alkalihalobacillus alcalophilus ATCC 27647 = CGMCC 1.3604]|uniref:Xylulose kinase n=1 Tax=Alkalihalobacillus alcalophilus ATCC 27647 = CGMCC 1.3604 TaxID=1218173 RepID=A0A094WIB3_ALKAL|nr:xylulokinase [Alkalihalobacillus alcalophilus]KGA97529.1 xylulose kinase [Alkalihalobacillus alcalophilus ATCC 27647 = CGMCC 1.3604]MED1560782.1 xylulokinase [Alkalihalobacillus alcalophilus]THG92430.1 D-xylulose kinase [Alkalihalobacillus alcalophilus ATCC 27647 = CGMCC 1.3604]
MKYVLGVDLGTSAVKIVLVNQAGEVVHEVSKDYPLKQIKAGFSEQNPNDWVEQTLAGLSELVASFEGNAEGIEGLSFSGQMHGLVLLDEDHEPLRDAILWNDTRTTEECRAIYETLGQETLLEITKNPALEGFTLPKILWVKKHEPELFAKVKTFLLPKDYVRLKLTGNLHMEFSDAAGTLLLDVTNKRWSEKLASVFELEESFFPPLVDSHQEVGLILAEVAAQTGLSAQTRVFAGGADNACGAIGAGVNEEGKTLVSIGTSGVVLSFESGSDKNFAGEVHYFNHSVPNSFYTMGVTLAAGYSLSWFKDTFAKEESFDLLLAGAKEVPVGSNGLLFTPYLVGERTPHADSAIRASFIGIDGSHERAHFVRAVIEGITFSLNESIEIFRSYGKKIDTITSIGGGAKSDLWLQIQADIFNAKVVKLSSEQGPGMGAAMIAAYGCGWFKTLKQCGDAFLQVDKEFEPSEENVKTYQELFKVYQSVYSGTKEMNEQLVAFRN